MFQRESRFTVLTAPNDANRSPRLVMVLELTPVMPRHSSHVRLQARGPDTGLTEGGDILGGFTYFVRSDTTAYVLVQHLVEERVTGQAADYEAFRLLGRILRTSEGAAAFVEFHFPGFGERLLKVLSAVPE